LWACVHCDGVAVGIETRPTVVAATSIDAETARHSSSKVAVVGALASTLAETDVALRAEQLAAMPSSSSAYSPAGTVSRSSPSVWTTRTGAPAPCRRYPSASLSSPAVEMET
jgi:hypothetical protein